MHTPRRTYPAFALIVIFSLSLDFAFATRGLAGETQASQETTSTFLPLLIRGYSYREAVGILDPEFNGSGKVVTQFSAGIDIAFAIALQPDGKLLAAGRADGLGYALARYQPDGSLDTSFGGDGLVTTNLGDGDLNNAVAALAIVLQQDGKILLVGEAYYSGVENNIGLARFLPDGSPDTSFGEENGWVVTDLNTLVEFGTDLVLQPDGKILVAGVADDDFLLLRYNSDGSLDTSFDQDGWLTTDFGSESKTWVSLVRQVDGKLVLASNADGGLGLVRYNSDGSLDEDFGLDGKVTLAAGSGSAHGNALGLTYDGKILVACSAYTEGTTDFLLARFLPDGSLDTSFGAGIGYVVTDFYSHEDLAVALVQQPDGKIVLAGSSIWEADSQTADFALARYQPDGSLDTSFGDAGRVIIDFNTLIDIGESLVLQPDGKLVVAGFTIIADLGHDFALARVK